MELIELLEKIKMLSKSIDKMRRRISFLENRMMKIDGQLPKEPDYNDNGLPIA